MKKELLIVLFLTLVPALLVKGVVNHVAEIRIDRVKLAQAYKPSFEASPIDSILNFRVRDQLFYGAHEDFYDPKGLGCKGDEYLENERYLIISLLQSSCVLPADIGLAEKEIGRVKDIGVVPCSLMFAEEAREMLQKVVSLNQKFMNITVERSTCDSYAAGLWMARTENDIRLGDYDALLNHWHAAWRHATSCRCTY